MLIYPSAQMPRTRERCFFCETAHQIQVPMTLTWLLIFFVCMIRVLSRRHRTVFCKCPPIRTTHHAHLTDKAHSSWVLKSLGFSNSGLLWGLRYSWTPSSWSKVLWYFRSYQSLAALDMLLTKQLLNNNTCCDVDIPDLAVSPLHTSVCFTAILFKGFLQSTFFKTCWNLTMPNGCRDAVVVFVFVARYRSLQFPWWPSKLGAHRLQPGVSYSINVRPFSSLSFFLFFTFSLAAVLLYCECHLCAFLRLGRWLTSEQIYRTLPLIILSRLLRSLL